jgi:hypothetical protein
MQIAISKNLQRGRTAKCRQPALAGQSEASRDQEGVDVESFQLSPKKCLFTTCYI